MTLVFGQQHAYTAPWFEARLGQSTTVTLEDFPHVAALRGDHATYLEYLAESWRTHPERNTPERRQSELEYLLGRQPSDDPRPIEVLTRPDGDQMIVNGNHRAAVAYARAQDLIAREEVDLGRWLRRNTRNDTERYGTGLRGIPYQTVYLEGRSILAGRRPDLARRHDLLDPGDLVGRVLDLGCNIGEASFLAARTASEVLGVDSSTRLVTSAVRLGTYLTSPARFRVADLETESFQGWDTVLCFAVLAHLGDFSAIRRTLASARVVYVEENAGGRPTFQAVADLFRHVERIYGGTRPIWRCEP